MGGAQFLVASRFIALKLHCAWRKALGVESRESVREHDPWQKLEKLCDLVDFKCILVKTEVKNCLEILMFIAGNLTCIVIINTIVLVYYFEEETTIRKVNYTCKNLFY